MHWHKQTDLVTILLYLIQTNRMRAIFYSEALKQPINLFMSTEMSPSVPRSSLRVYFLVLYLVASADCMINNVSNNSDCQLWHFLKNGHCSCGFGAINCDKKFIYIKQGTCMTWDNATSSAEIHHNDCLFIQKSDDTMSCAMQDVYYIPTGETLTI